MKSEHRHELETNLLSAQLAQWIEKLKPYSGQIGTGVLMLALVYAGLSVWDSQVEIGERAAWDAFALANDTSDPEMKSLYQVASSDEYTGTKMQEWAYVNWADRQVLIAMASSLADRKKTEDRLTSVLGIYEEMANSAGDTQVRNRARFGLARVYELQNKIDEARQQYMKVRGDLQLQANERAEQLDSEEVRQACEWLATTELPKRDLTGGQGASGARPGFGADLPGTEASKSSISAEKLDELLENFNSKPIAGNNFGAGGLSTETPAEETSETEASETEAPANAAASSEGEPAEAATESAADTTQE